MHFFIFEILFGHSNGIDDNGFDIRNPILTIALSKKSWFGIQNPIFKICLE